MDFVIRIAHLHLEFKIESGKDEMVHKITLAILDKLPNFSNYDQCFIHTDLGPHNGMMRPSGEVVLIDLDDAGIGSKYIDLGWVFIMQFVDYNHETEEMKYRFDLAEAFLQGYYGNEKISREEYELI